MKKGKKGKKRKIKLDFCPLSCAFDMSKQYKTVFMNVSVMRNFKNVQFSLKPEFNFWQFFCFENLKSNLFSSCSTMGDTAMKMREYSDKSILRLIQGASYITNAIQGEMYWRVLKIRFCYCEETWFLLTKYISQETISNHTTNTSYHQTRIETRFYESYYFFSQFLNTKKDYFGFWAN